MRRLLSIATIAFALAAAPAFAQRGGGHASGGGGRGGFAGHGGGFGGHVGGTSVGGMHGGSGFHSQGFRNSGFRSSGFRNPAMARRGFSRNPYLHSGLRQPALRGDRFRGERFRGDRFRGDRFRDRRFRNFGLRNCFGFNCTGFGWPWWWAGYDPWWDSWWWDSGSSYDQDRANEIQAANEMNQLSLEEQRARRDEDQDLYARQDPVPQQREVPRAETPTPATVLVFRDQHKQEVQNYAIVGRTLWAFAASRAQKIPLAELDLPATVKANDDRGIGFHVPEPSEAQ